MASQNYPQGTLSFSGGIPDTAVLSFSYTQQHGLAPGIIQVRMVELADPPQEIGTVTLSYGTTQITLPDCTVEKVVEVDDLWNVTLLDRRWRWCSGRISGKYNVRWHDGTGLREETQKTPSELAELCLEAMNETGYDLGAIEQFDGIDWPEVDWDYASPAKSLQALCERYGCRPIYAWKQDRVVIVMLGEGAELDLSLPYVEDSPAFNPPAKPGKIVLVCGPTSVQADLPLVAVGVDVDGEIKLLPKLSYAPGPPAGPNSNPIGGGTGTGPGGGTGTGTGPSSLPTQSPDFTSGTYVDEATGFWNTLGGGLFGLPAPYLHHLATENVYRLYRIQPPTKWSGLNAAKGDATQSSLTTDLETWPDLSQDNANSWLWQLSLRSEQNDPVAKLVNPLSTQVDEYNWEISSSALPAWVYGQYCTEASSFRNVLLDDVDSNANVLKRGILKLDPRLVAGPVQLNTSTAPNVGSPTTVSNQVIDSGFCSVGFSIEAEYGLVKFKDPVFQLLPPKQSGVTATFSDGTPLPVGVTRFPASLWLRTRFLLRDPETRGWVRAERVRTLDKSNETVCYVVRNDLVLQLTYRYAGPPNISHYPPTFQTFQCDSNWSEISEAADAYLDEIEEQYETREAQSVVYAGFFAIELDGAIQEITWYVDLTGFALMRVIRSEDQITHCCESRCKCEPSEKKEPKEKKPKEKTEKASCFSSESPCFSSE